MPLIEANGVKLHIQQLGSAGPLICMLHGLVLGTKSTWFFGIGPALSESHRVLLYDLRGHGLSEPVETGYTLADMTADLDAVHATLNYEPMTLVGHSYGGALALRYASTYPERVKRLVVVESPMPVISPDINGLLWARERQEETVRTTGEAIMGQLSTEQKDEITKDMPLVVKEALLKTGKRPNLLLAQIMRLVGKTTMIEDVMAEPPVTEEELRRITCPVLLCYGETSDLRPDEGHILLTALKDHELRILPGGHGLPQQTTAELLAAISDFLRD